jgi:hypothetical protein
MTDQEVRPRPEVQPDRVIRRRHFSIFWPVLLISVGVFLFLNNIGVVQGSGWDLVLRLWPLLLIVGGLDGLFRREGLVGAVVLIGLGVVFLLGTLGYLGLSAWEVILRFWPVFLVALGLDILIGHKRPWAPVIGAVVGLLLVAGIAFLIVSAPAITNVRTEPVNFALNNVTQSNGRINMAVGRLEVGSGAAATALADGQMRLGVLGNVRSSGSGGNFNLDADSSSYVSFGPNDSDRWTIQLNPMVQYNLNVNMGVGEEIVDLSALKAQNIDLNMAVGRIEVRLPTETSVSGTVKGAVGETVVYVPRNATVSIHLDSGLTGVNYPPEYSKVDKELSSPSQAAGAPSVTLTVAQALGSISIRYLP